MYQRILPRSLLLHSKLITLTTMADTSVKANDTITTVVAIQRVSANILRICLNGPIRKHVLAIDSTLPNVYRTAKRVSPRCRNSISEPSSDSRMPSTKHMTKPLMRVDQLSVEASFSCA